MEHHSLLMLVCLFLIGCIGLLNLRLHHLMEFLNLPHPITNLQIWLLIHPSWHKIKWTQRIQSIYNLELRQTGCLAWGLIVGKLTLCHEQIPNLKIRFYQDFENGPQSSVGDFSLAIHLGMTSSTILELGAHLLQKCYPKIV